MSKEDVQEFLAKQRMITSEETLKDDRLNAEIKFRLDVLELENINQPKTEDQAPTN